MNCWAADDCGHGPRRPISHGGRSIDERRPMALTTPQRGRAPVPPPPERSRTRAEVKARTYRVDRWWLAPLVQFLGLFAFIVYGTVAAFRNAHYFDVLVPVAVLLAVSDQPVRRPLHAGVPRRLVALLAGVPDPDLPAGLPLHLLLLPQGLLPRLLAVAAGLRRAGRAQQVHRREPLPADHPEHPPLLLLRRVAVRDPADLRPRPLLRLRRPLLHRRRHRGAGDQRRR